MSLHISALAKVVRGLPIRAMGEAIGRAVCLTDAELITVRALVFRTNVDRFRLRALRHVWTIPNLHARVLIVEFDDTTPATLTLLFSAPRNVPEFELIATLLQRRLGIGARGRVLSLNAAARRRQMHAINSRTHPSLVPSGSLAG